MVLVLVHHVNNELQGRHRAKNTFIYKVKMVSLNMDFYRVCCIDMRPRGIFEASGFKQVISNCVPCVCLSRQNKCVKLYKL